PSGRPLARTFGHDPLGPFAARGRTQRRIDGVARLALDDLRGEQRGALKTNTGTDQAAAGAIAAPTVPHVTEIGELEVTAGDRSQLGRVSTTLTAVHGATLRCSAGADSFDIATPIIWHFGRSGTGALLLS